MSIHGLKKEHLKSIKKILSDTKDVYIYGSRAKETYRKSSDLDICIKNNISGYQYELLKEKFEKSDLPFFVDIIEYNKVDNAFKNILDKEMVSFEDFLNS